jgi:arylsulfatase
VQALLARWDECMKANDVTLPSRSPFENSENTMPKRFPDDPGCPPLTCKKQFVPPPGMIKRWTRPR